MNIRVAIAYSCILFYNPNIILFLKKIISLLKHPSLYNEFCKQHLDNIILHSYRTTTYYQEIFDKAGLVRNGRVYMDRFNLVPILDKEIIRKRKYDLKSTKTKRIFTNTSGGSTGEPVQFIQDNVYYARMVADTLLFSFLNGKHPGQKEIKLWGSERDIFEGTIGPKEKFVNLFFNRTFLNSFKLTDKMISEYIDEIKRQKPVQIWTYTDSILELAKYINQNDTDVFSPRNIICTAGTMYPEIRSEIQKAFPESRIINQYGSREVGQIACQTENDESIMIFSHSNFVELVDPDTQEIITEPYRPGKVLITNLNNYSMPLIRFDIGDIAEYAPKKDQKYESFTHFAKLHGRDNAHFISKDGHKIHGEYFTHLFYDKPWINNFQVIQKSPTWVNILLIKAPERDMEDNDMEDIVRKIKLVLGEDVKVDFVEVNSLSKLESGKYQFVRRNF